MGGLRISNEVIFAKIETTVGTDSVPVAATNAILVRNPKLSPEGLRMPDREAIRASVGQLQTPYGGQLKRITFECEGKGSGAAGTAPEIGPLLRACGMGETVVGATSVTYLPISTAHESVTIYYFEGGRKRHILTGCRGTVSVRVEAGGLMIFSFELVGHVAGPSDQTLPSPTYNSTVPRTALNMAVAINSVSAIVARSWAWALNWTITTPPSIGAADGYGEVILTKRNVTGNILIESELVSTLDLDTLLSGGTRFAFASGTLGSSAGNRIVVSTPSGSTYVTNPEHDEGDGLRLRNVMLAVDDSTANQELSIAFT